MATEESRLAALGVLRSAKNGRSTVATVRTVRPPKGSKAERMRTKRLESIVSSLDKLPKQLATYRAERVLESWRLRKGDRGKKLLTRPVRPPVPRSIQDKSGSLLPAHLRDLPPLSEEESSRLAKGIAHVPRHLKDALAQSRAADKERARQAAAWKKKRGF